MDELDPTDPVWDTVSGITPQRAWIATDQGTIEVDYTRPPDPSKHTVHIIEDGTIVIRAPEQPQE